MKNHLTQKLVLMWVALVIALGAMLSGAYFRITGGPHSEDEKGVITAIEAEVALDSNRIGLGALLPQFPWQRVCSMDSYFSSQDLAAAVGKPVSNNRALAWRNLEHVWTLLFIAKDGDEVLPVRVSKIQIGYLKQKRWSDAWIDLEFS